MKDSNERLKINLQFLIVSRYRQVKTIIRFKLRKSQHQERYL